MRFDVIKCEVCAAEHDAQMVLPAEWITTTQTYSDGKEHHYCSKACLVAWAGQDSKKYSDHVEEHLKNLDISLGLLDPKSAALSPAALFAMDCLLETVKDDYTKLKDTIARRIC